MQSIIKKKEITVILALFIFISFFKCLYSNDGPTLLKKSEKKEKLREEDLVTKKVDINDLVITNYISLDLVRALVGTF